MWRCMPAAVGVPVRAVRLQCWGARRLFGWSRDKEARMKKKQEL